jgi:hypothetical protein
MAVAVLVLGQSGTGKSYSMKNFKEDEVCLISVQKALLPFRKKFEETVVTDNYKDIIRTMKATKKRVIVIDDTQYLMCNEFMRRATEKGYDKFTEIAQNFWSLVVQEVNGLPADTIVYLLCHTATDENGVEKMKTIGKLVDEKITPEGLFTIVLKTAVSDGQYYFITQNNGKDTVKSPEGMFSTYAINNDLKYVDEKIRNYYELGNNFLTDEEVVEIDKLAERTEIEPPKDRSERKRRGANAETEEQPERKRRKSREEVQDANHKAIADYMSECDKSVEEVADGRSEVPWEEVGEATASVAAPELETVPRRRRRRTE